MTAAPVSIVVPCRNEAHRIRTLLDGIRRQDAPVHDIVIVDSSTDGTLEVLAQYGAAHPDLPMRVVRYEGPPSTPAAFNLGVRHATGDLIMRLDGHCTPDPQYVRRVAEVLADPTVGVAGGIWQIAPGAPTAVAEAIAVAASHPVGAGDAAYRITRQDEAPRDVDTVPFASFHKSWWDEIGGMDESLLSNQDYEFNYRTRKHGRRVVLDPAIRSTYFARPTLRLLARQYYRYGWWKAQMLRSHPESLRWRQALPAAFVAGVLLMAVLTAILAVTAPAAFVTRLVAGLLAAGLGSYVAALLAASVHACAGRGSWRPLPAVPAAFATIHFAWGTGALVNWLTGGRRTGS